jgi:addiction module HigA family antidote
MAQSKIVPVHPGEMLLEEFLKPMGISQYRLAKEISVSQRRISEIVHGRRSITADTDLRLCRFLGLSDGYWLRLQAHFDMVMTRDRLAVVVANIHPWQAKKPIGANHARV